MRRIKNLYTIGILLLIGCGPTAVVDHAQDKTPILIRSPQPDVASLEELHKHYKIKTIINLRGADIQENSQLEWHQHEQKFCKINSITYIIMDFNDGTLPPSEDDIDLFFYLCSTRYFWPIFIHCQAGIHRTGFLVALYRIQFNGWTSDQAIAEMERYWYNWSISDRSAIKAYLKNYKRRSIKQYK